MISDRLIYDYVIKFDGTYLIFEFEFLNYIIDILIKEICDEYNWPFATAI